MNRIITIGRQFGSGGRELGRRVAQALNMAYYDREVITEIVKRTQLSEAYVQQVVEHRPNPLYPITIGQSFPLLLDPTWEMNRSIYREQTNVIVEMAQKSDCVIVGRCADDILKEHHPLRLFVYAEMEHRLRRTRKHAAPEEQLSDKQLQKKILDMDHNRAQYYRLYTGKEWGDKENYDLCLNTSGMEIVTLADWVAQLAKGW